MAIYYFRAQIISRNQGRSAVAASAYRSAEELKCEYDGLTHSYTKKRFVEHKEVMLPKNAPKEYMNRQTLWNAVEMSERANNAQLAREIVLALPKELSIDESRELIRNFCQTNFVDEGMVVDYAIHNPARRDDRGHAIDEYGRETGDEQKYVYDNPHSHIMLTLRPLDINGEWEAKSQKEYLCILKGQEKAFTSDEFVNAKKLGWQKQYQYFDEEGKKVWLTKEEAEQRNLKRVNKSPKSTPYGRQNPKVAEWNSAEKLDEWKKAWEEAVNGRLAEKQIDVRIDCRSYEEQGLDILPQLHLGPEAAQLKRRAERLQREGKVSAVPDLEQINEEIRKHNSLVIELKRKFEALVAQTTDMVDKVARKLEGIRSRLIGHEYQQVGLQKKSKRLEKLLQYIKGQQYQERYDDLLAVQNTIDKTKAEAEAMVNDYVMELEALSESNYIQVETACHEYRKDFEHTTYEALQKRYGEYFDKDLFEESKRKVDKKLSTDGNARIAKIEKEMKLDRHKSMEKTKALYRR